MINKILSMPEAMYYTLMPFRYLTFKTPTKLQHEVKVVPSVILLTVLVAINSSFMNIVNIRGFTLLL